jgi:hypothetical protein
VQRVQLGHQFARAAAATPKVQNVVRRSSEESQIERILDLLSPYLRSKL